MSTKKLTENNEKEFFQTVSVGEVFTYSNSFIPQEIKKLAKENGLKVEYCKPGTSEYKAHGCHTMVVLGKVRKLINLRDAFLRELQENRHTSPKDVGFAQTYYHIFAMQNKEALERDLIYLFKLRRGEDDYFKETSKDCWFAIWHKTIRQSDYFNDCYKKTPVKVMTDDERAELRFLGSQIMKGTIHRKRGRKKGELFTQEYRRYLNLQEKRRGEEMDESIGGHLDMVLWNLIHADSNCLYNKFDLFFDWYERDILAFIEHKENLKLA
jgi:hypothetical protein